ncbi:unnamed protein product [Phaeothamnion confervicola]
MRDQLAAALLQPQLLEAGNGAFVVATPLRAAYSEVVLALLQYGTSPRSRLTIAATALAEDQVLTAAERESCRKRVGLVETPRGAESNSSGFSGGGAGSGSQGVSNPDDSDSRASAEIAPTAFTVGRSAGPLPPQPPPPQRHEDGIGGVTAAVAAGALLLAALLAFRGRHAVGSAAKKLASTLQAAATDTATFIVGADG